MVGPSKERGRWSAASLRLFVNSFLSVVHVEVAEETEWISFNGHALAKGRSQESDDGVSVGSCQS